MFIHNYIQQHYILKQCWRPREATTEGDLYETAGNESQNIPQVYSSEEVIVGGSVDDTVLAIRRGMTHASLSLDPPPRRNGKPRDEDEDTKLHMITTDSFHTMRFFLVRPPQARVLTRLLMETYGWPIKHFSSLAELLHVMRDAIQGILNHFPFQNHAINGYWYPGHKHLYYKGILHRNVSAANILICPNGANAHNTVGCLIDLDHAKQTTNFKNREPVIVNPDDQDKGFRSYCKGVSMWVQIHHEPGIDSTAVAVLISRMEDHPLSYVKHVLASKPWLKECKRPVSDLHIVFF